MKSVILKSLSVMLLGLACGCITVSEDYAPQAARDAEWDRLRESSQRATDRLEGVQLEQQRVRDDMERLRAALESENARLRRDVEELGRQVKALDAARAADRKAIVDELTQKMAKLLEARPAAPAPAPARGGALTGYEHVVKPGETLSEIAAAYNVRIDAIIRANSLSNPDSLRAGQKLFIPE